MNDRLAVVAYPVLGAADREWMESIRAEHDPQARMLAAHFTLVFPAEAPREAAFDDVALAAHAVGAFSFVLRSAKAVRDALGTGGHVFLVPEEGAAQIVTLHDRLYRAAFEPFRRSDIPYVPHITVAAKGDWSLCEALADHLNREGRQVSGRVDVIELLEIGAGTLTSVFKAPLAGH